MDLNEIRLKIDEIDDNLVKNFCERMRTVAEVAAYKKSQGLPVLDAARERKKLEMVADKAGEEMADYTAALYALMFELSRSYEHKLMGIESNLPKIVQDALDTTPKMFPARAVVACQGVEGAFSQLACEKLFRQPQIFYFSSFDAVFSAIDKGLCRYGVLPVENSTAGSVNAIYDLMSKHDFKIVRSVRLRVEHNLLVYPGTKLVDIKTIYSHPQAIAQCSEFLSTLKGVKIIPVENTARAAKTVSESRSHETAAIASRACIDLYGLENLSAGIQNNSANYTRFICISKNTEIYPGADRTSIMLTLDNKPGALYKILARFYSLGVNLVKLESRPIPGSDFEFDFYFDLDASIYSPSLIRLIGELDMTCRGFRYLGSYSEVI